MKISDMFLLCLVFLITWKETTSQKITKEQKSGSTKRIHESNNAHENVNLKEIALNISNEAQQALLTPINLVFGKKTPYQSYQPLNANKKTIDHNDNHQPYVMYMKKKDIEKDLDTHKVNKTMASEITFPDEKEEDNTIVEKIIENLETNNNGNLDKPVDIETTAVIPDSDKPNRKDLKGKKKHKSRKEKEIKSHIQSIKTPKQKEQLDSSSEDKAVQIQKDPVSDLTEQVVITKVEEEEKQESKSEKDSSKKMRQEEKQFNHLDEYPTLIKPDYDIKQTNNDDESVVSVIYKNEGEDEGGNDEIIIKSDNYEEIFQRSHAPCYAHKYGIHNIQDNCVHSPLDENDYINQHVTTNLPIIDQVKDATIFSYNNFYKKPMNIHWKDECYDYQMPKQNYVKMVDNQDCRYGRDNLWRSWRRSECIIKSKNAWKNIYENVCSGFS